MVQPGSVSVVTENREWCNSLRSSQKVMKIDLDQVILTFSDTIDLVGIDEVHQEKLDGSGYPFHRTAEELGIESRIVMVADIFQALAQNRSCRPAQSP